MTFLLSIRGDKKDCNEGLKYKKRYDAEIAVKNIRRILTK